MDDALGVRRLHALDILDVLYELVPSDAASIVAVTDRDLYEVGRGGLWLDVGIFFSCRENKGGGGCLCPVDGNRSTPIPPFPPMVPSDAKRMSRPSFGVGQLAIASASSPPFGLIR